MGDSRVVLEAVDEGGHVAVVRQLLSEPTNFYRYRRVGPLVSNQSLGRLLTDGVLMQALLLSDVNPGEERRAVAGFVQAFGYSPRHGTVQLGVVLSDFARGAAWTLYGVIYFLNHVFYSHSLRKVYLEVPSQNLASVGSLDRLFRTEGKLVDHEMVGNRAESVHFFSITREEFIELDVVQRALGVHIPLGPAIRGDIVAALTDLMQELGFSTLAAMDSLAQLETISLSEELAGAELDPQALRYCESAGDLADLIMAARIVPTVSPRVG